MKGDNFCCAGKQDKIQWCDYIDTSDDPYFSLDSLAKYDDDFPHLHTGVNATYTRDYLKLFTLVDVTSHCKLTYGNKPGGLYVLLDVGL